MEENRERRQLAIKDPQLALPQKRSKKQEAKQEHEQELQTREQSHTHTVNSSLITSLTTEIRYARKISSFLCVLLLGLIVGAIYLIASEEFQVSAGLGFTLGIISSVLATFFQKLIKKIWDFDDLHKPLNKSENKPFN